jgi:hypothetical protein
MRSALLVPLVVALVVAPPAASALAPGGEDEPAKPEPPPELSPRSPSLDFDLLGTPREKADPALQHAIETRRTMLTLHQGLGFASWAAMTATVVVGQLDFNDRFRGGGDTGKYHGWHTGLAIGTSTLFLASGLLAILAPKPFPTPLRLDTALLHKIAMGAAAAGMITQIVLGLVARGQDGSVSERNVATVHQVVGYATLGAMTAGVVVFLF